MVNLFKRGNITIHSDLKCHIIYSEYARLFSEEHHRFFLRFPSPKRTFSAPETYVSQLRNIGFRGGKHKKLFGMKIFSPRESGNKDKDNLQGGLFFLICLPCQSPL